MQAALARERAIGSGDAKKVHWLHNITVLVRAGTGRMARSSINFPEEMHKEKPYFSGKNGGERERESKWVWGLGLCARCGGNSANICQACSPPPAPPLPPLPLQR